MSAKLIYVVASGDHGSNLYPSVFDGLLDVRVITFDMVYCTLRCCIILNHNIPTLLPKSSPHTQSYMCYRQSAMCNAGSNIAVKYLEVLNLNGGFIP